MQELDIVAVLHGGMLATLNMGVPLLLAPLAAGLVMAVIQAVTQINDSSVAFLPKLVSAGAAAWIAEPFMFHVPADYTHEVADKTVATGGQELAAPCPNLILTWPDSRRSPSLSFRCCAAAWVR